MLHSRRFLGKTHKCAFVFKSRSWLQLSRQVLLFKRFLWTQLLCYCWQMESFSFELLMGCWYQLC